MTLPQRTLGRTGHAATILGLGGEGVLRTFGYDHQAEAVIKPVSNALFARPNIRTPIRVHHQEGLMCARTCAVLHKRQLLPNATSASAEKMTTEVVTTSQSALLTRSDAP